MIGRMSKTVSIAAKILAMSGARAIRARMSAIAGRAQPLVNSPPPPPRPPHIGALGLGVALAVLAIAACFSPTSASLPAPTPSALAAASPVPAPLFAPSPVPGPSPVPTTVPTPFPAPSATATPVPPPAAAPIPVPAPLLAPSETATATPFPAPARSPVPSPPPDDGAARSTDALAWADGLAQIVLGESRACGLGEDRRAVCNRGGPPEEAGAPPTFSALSSGRKYACGLRDSGGIFCWGGDDGYGEISGAPAEGGFSALSAGKRHACALDADGAAVCWGWDANGRATPPPDARFLAIAAGDSHSCGIAMFGNLICWGRNQYGQSEPREGPFSALALGNNYTCALRTDGTAVCQGDDSDGQSSPPSGMPFAQIAAGDRQTCGVTPLGGLECWGIISMSDRSQMFASASVGYGRICALNLAGAATCSPPLALAEDPLGGHWLDAAVEMFPLPDGGAAVAERKGYIEIHPPEGGERRIALDLVARTAIGGEKGLLSAAPDPEFERFPFIYVYWHTNADGGAGALEGRVSRFPAADGGDISADGELVILRMPIGDSLGHFGGAIRFGADGMMYLGLGDRAEFGIREHPESAGDLATLSGKIIRIDIRGATESAPYRVPPDNPFVGVDGARPEIWARGLRNPWRMSFAPNGDLIVADVGHHSREELSIIERGADMGWPVFEGSVCNDKDDARCGRREDYVFPIHEYAHDSEDENCAIIGGMHAPGGDYVFGDHCSGRVWTLERSAPDVWSANEIMDLPRPIVAFGADADGTVYALTNFGPAVPVGD